MYPGNQDHFCIFFHCLLPCHSSPFHARPTCIRRTQKIPAEPRRYQSTCHPFRKRWYIPDILTGKRSAGSNGNSYRLVSSFVLILFCLFRMERYQTAAMGTVPGQRPAIEQVETARPDYRFAMLPEERENGHPTTVSVIFDRYASSGTPFPLSGHDCFISSALPLQPNTVVISEPLGFLRQRHYRFSPDDDSNAPVSI